MGTGYTRNDTTNNIANGNVINASDLDGEFDAIVDAFNATTGHTHDGTAAEGAPITVLGPAQDFIADANSLSPKGNGTYDLGTTSLRYDVAYLNSVNAGGAVLQEGDTANTLKGPLYQLAADPSYDIDGSAGASEPGAFDALQFIKGGIVRLPDSAAITSANKGSALWLYDNSFLSESASGVKEGAWAIAGKMPEGETQKDYSIHAIYAEDGKVYVACATSFIINAMETDGSDVNGAIADFYPDGITLRKDVTILGNILPESATLTTNSTNQVTLATFPHATYKGAKVLISANSSVGTEMTEILIATNGVTVANTQNGAQTSNIAAYTVDISGADVRVRVTPAAITTTTFNVGMTLLE